MFNHCLFADPHQSQSVFMHYPPCPRSERKYVTCHWPLLIFAIVQNMLATSGMPKTQQPGKQSSRGFFSLWTSSNMVPLCIHAADGCCTGKLLLKEPAFSKVSVEQEIRINTFKSKSFIWNTLLVAYQFSELRTATDNTKQDSNR